MGALKTADLLDVGVFVVWVLRYHYLSGLPRSGKKYLENEFFQVREKSGNFVAGQGNLERTWKVREF